MLSSLDSQPWTIFHTHAYCSIKQWVGWGTPTYCCGSQAQGRLVAPRYTAHKEQACQTPGFRHPEGTCPQIHPPTHRFSPSSLGTIISCWEFLGMDFCVICNRSGISQQDRLPETFGWFVCVCVCVYELINSCQLKIKTHPSCRLMIPSFRKAAPGWGWREGGWLGQNAAVQTCLPSSLLKQRYIGLAGVGAMGIQLWSIPLPLIAPCVVLALPGTWLEMQNPGPH